MRNCLTAFLAVALLSLGFGCSKEKSKSTNMRSEAEKSNRILKPREESTPLDSAAPATSAVPNDSMVMPSQVRQPRGVTLKQFFDSLKIPEVVAIVDGEKITKKDIFNEIASPIPMSVRDKPFPPRALAGLAGELHKIVETIVNRKLMLKLAAADGIKPSPELLTQAFDKYVSGLDKRQREQFEKALKAQGVSIAEKRAEAAKDINSQEGMAINKWITEKVLPSLKIDDAEAEKFYKENSDRFKRPATVKVAHILLTPERPNPEKMKDMTFEQKKAFAENADKKAKAKAEKILAQVKAGVDFAKLAKENSACPSGKLSKGELPAFDMTGATNDRRGGKMDRTFTAASFKLDPGEISGLVKTPYGYHIIKGVKKTKASVIPFAEIEKNLKENLKKEKMAEKLQGMIEEAKKKNKVEIFLKGPVPVPKPEPMPVKPITI
ncbi:MAG: hypothetical protein GXP32_06690 [Kiritimatiellaeota bacterium]|nr:hypothetical protein [Kiritimatiellota bacterium]